VKNTYDEAVKSIKCPNCQTPLKVVFRQQQQKPLPTDSGATQLPGKHFLPPVDTDLGLTQLGPKCTKLDDDETQAKPKLCPGRLVCNGIEYPLQMGQNIVGRKNHTKPTTIMLDVNDSYMSRMHICINIEQVGDKLRATVTNYQNTNETKVAGQPLAKGEMVILNNGMTISMGESTVTYLAD